jgi:hypothetical protein
LLKNYLNWRFPTRPRGSEDEYVKLIDDLYELPVWPTDRTLEIDTLREVDEILNQGLEWFLIFEETHPVEGVAYTDVRVLFIIALHFSNSRIP